MPDVGGELETVRRTWEAFGEEDPLWAVLTDPAKRGGRWDPEEFFATGELEVASVFERLGRLGIHPSGRALDFGCGAGRLTRALGSRFDQVTGVDVSAPMIEAARRLNADRGNLTFLVNTRPDLTVIESGSIGFLYSRLVFQHMPPALALGYVGEIGRILERDGVAAFQVPREAIRASGLEGAARSLARGVRARVDRRPRMEFHAVRPGDVRAALEAGGAELVAELDDPEACDWPSYLYVARARRSRSSPS